MQTAKHTSLRAALAKRSALLHTEKPTTALLAIIRKDSKYAYQSAHHEEPFSVRVRNDDGGYVLIGGYGGHYRIQDVHLFAETPQGLVELSSEPNCHDD